MAGSIDGSGGGNVNIITRGGGIDEPGSAPKDPRLAFKQRVAKRFGLDISFPANNVLRFDNGPNANHLRLHNRVFDGAMAAGKLLGKNKSRQEDFSKHLRNITSNIDDQSLHIAGNRLRNLTKHAGTPDENPDLKKLKQALRVSAGKPDGVRGSWIKGNAAKAQMLRSVIRKTVLTTYLKTGSIEDAQIVRRQMIAELHRKNADNPRISNMQAYFNSKPGQAKGLETFGRMLNGAEDLPAASLHDAINDGWPAKRAAGGGVRRAHGDSNVNLSNRNVEPGQQRVVNIDNRSRASSATTENDDVEPGQQNVGDIGNRSRSSSAASDNANDELPAPPRRPDENLAHRTRGQSDAGSVSVDSDVSDDEVSELGRRVDDKARREQIEGDREIAKYMVIKDKRTLDGGDEGRKAQVEDDHEYAKQVFIADRKTLGDDDNAVGNAPQTGKDGEDDISEKDELKKPVGNHIKTPEGDDDDDEGNEVETIGRPDVNDSLNKAVYREIAAAMEGDDVDMPAPPDPPHQPKVKIDTIE